MKEISISAQEANELLLALDRDRETCSGLVMPKNHNLQLAAAKLWRKKGHTLGNGTFYVMAYETIRAFGLRLE